MRHHPSRVENEAKGRKDREGTSFPASWLCTQVLSITQGVEQEAGTRLTKGTRKEMKGGGGYTENQVSCGRNSLLSTTVPTAVGFSKSVTILLHSPPTTTRAEVNTIHLLPKTSRQKWGFSWKDDAVGPQWAGYRPVGQCICAWHFCKLGF